MARLTQLFAPADREFFALFEEAGTNTVRAADLLDQLLRGWPDNKELGREILICEQEGDRITREAIASLFDGGIDPMVVIRWKDIYERLEAAIDACERVAHILESVVIKNA
jgi:uncharacterized protein Yka (UPF0111/DUF47 family)